MTTTVEIADPARDIAAAYWAGTPHIFVKNYPDDGLCTYCRRTENVADFGHIQPTPKPTPVVTEVIDKSNPRLHTSTYEIGGSCGHQPRTQSIWDHRTRPQKIGDPFDCWTCEMEWHDANYPGIPEAITEQVLALIPRCPECGERVKYLPFLTFTRHEISFDLDSTGDLNSESSHEDTLDEQPEWQPASVSRYSQLADGWQTGEIAVSCENGHDWKTTKLAWKHEGGDDRWRIIGA